MRYVTRHPGPRLGDFIEYFWSLSDAPAHQRVNLEQDELRIFAGGPSAEGRRFPGAILSGCYGQSFGIDTRDHASIVGVHFRPGGAAGLLGAPPGELSDLHVALEDLWGDSAGELRDRLCAARSSADRFWILECTLTARLPDTPHGSRAVAHAVRLLDRPRVVIGEIAEELQLSRRRFIEVFTRDVGMTPKRYARVQRFQRALSLATMSPSQSWVHLALECGYYDQAHLCREWAELTGLSPSDLIALRSARVKVNHVALPSWGSHLSNTGRRTNR